MAANDTRASVVCDAGPLIHLDELGCLDLLADFAQVLVPEAVWAEVSRHRPAASTLHIRASLLKSIIDRVKQEFTLD